MEQENFTQSDAIEKTLQSIDGISKAEMPPFFYTRLQARLEKKQVLPAAFWQVFGKPAVSLVTLTLLVVLNVAAIRYFTKLSKQTVTEQRSGIQKFAQEYNLGASSVYADKTSNP